MRDHSADRGREALRAAGRAVPFHRNDRLIVAGTESTEVLLVEAGLIKAVLPDRDGFDTVAGIYGPGDLLGEMGVVGRRPRSAHIIALSSGRAVHVSAHVFRRLQGEGSDVRELLDETWRKRQKYADDRQLAQARDVSTRVAMALLGWARAFGRATEHGLQVRGLSQRDIAQAVCASEKTVEAALRELRSAGLLITQRLRYSLPSPNTLESLVSETGSNH